MHNSTTHMPNTCDTEALNSLLRGELSAIETYDQAIEKITDPTVQAELRRIREEHSYASARLKERVIKYGAKASESSGIWGTFAAAVTGTAKVIGPGTTLTALKQGEEHGISEYDKTMTNDDVNSECKQMIQTQLLPQCHRHVAELDRLIGGVK